MKFDSYDEHDPSEDDDIDSVSQCPLCGGEDDEHALGCPENNDPFALLIREGFD